MTPQEGSADIIITAIFHCRSRIFPSNLPHPFSSIAVFFKNLFENITNRFRDDNMERWWCWFEQHNKQLFRMTTLTVSGLISVSSIEQSCDASAPSVQSKIALQLLCQKLQERTLSRTPRGAGCLSLRLQAAAAELRSASCCCFCCQCCCDEMWDRAICQIVRWGGEDS